MPRKRLRMKTFSFDVPKTYEHAVRGFLEPKSRMVPPKPRRRASEKVFKGGRASEKDRTEQVESAINGWGLLGGGLEGIDRNLRVSGSLSPIFYLFLRSSGPLYQKAPEVLAHNEGYNANPPPNADKRLPVPKHPHAYIPTEY